jgi:hypothetical protein
MVMGVSEWYNFMGVHPWHGMQLSNALIPLNSKCSALVYEYAWQNADRAGRNEIRQAIEEAERLFHQYSRVWPSPRFVEVTLPYPPLGDTRYTRFFDVGGQGRWLNVQVPDAELIALGPAVESDNATEALTYTDEDGDGLFETATAIATVTSGTTASEVVARFLAADCGPVTPPEITPRSVEVSGVNATLVFNTWDLVRPVRYQGAASGTLDPGNGVAPAATVCAPSIEVFRRRADPTGTTIDTAMAVLEWETTPYPWWAWCCTPTAGDAEDPAAVAQAIARCVIRDAHNGIIAFGEAAYDSDTQEWQAVCDWRQCRAPDRITLRYQAGGMDGWQRTLAGLAAATVNRGVCACDGANHAIYDWQKDLSQTGATNDLYQAPDDFSNPLGSRRGQIAAWRFLSQQQRLVGLYGG